jgi:hypothetical protein
MDGRLLSIAIMIIGISLFLRLVQAVFRPKAGCASRARAAGCSATISTRSTARRAAWS